MTINTAEWLTACDQDQEIKMKIKIKRLWKVGAGIFILLQSSMHTYVLQFNYEGYCVAIVVSVAMMI